MNVVMLAMTRCPARSLAHVDTQVVGVTNEPVAAALQLWSRSSSMTLASSGESGDP